MFTTKEIILRDYQIKTIESLRSKIAEGKKRIILALPTGAGKTSIASEIIKKSRDRGKRSLFVAHRQELIYQAHDRLAHWGVNAGVIMNRHRWNGSAVHVASIQTLTRRSLPPAELIIVDEAHHSVSPSLKKILDQYKDAVVLGLTATPYRMDGKPLGDIYEDIIAPISVQSLIDKGYLIQPKYYGAKQDLSGVKVKMGEYDNKELFEKADKKVLYDGVVEKFKQFGQGKALVFCINIEHSKKTLQAFIDAGYKSAHLDCDTREDERKTILAKFKSGEYQILTNCAILTEGYDLPDIGTVILNRATKSKCLYTQMVGRGLRPAEGKDHCIIIDHGNNVYEHGFVEWPEEYDIHERKEKKQKDKDLKGSLMPVKECPACFKLVHSKSLKCFFCNFQFQMALLHKSDKKAVFPCSMQFMRSHNFPAFLISSYGLKQMP
ncbi:MAG: DEAD/DEAH box helicase [Candidatus Jettenia caeni]|nr:MAG: DEAD/DEAH box helicase [Candidatus Jettenia caeni]